MCEPKRSTEWGPVLTVAADVSCVVFAWKVLEMFKVALEWMVAVGTVGGVVALALVVRYVRRTGPMWRPDQAAVPQRAVKRPAVAAVPSPAELPVRQRAALVARQVAPGHFSVIPETALNVAPSGSDTTT